MSAVTKWADAGPALATCNEQLATVHTGTVTGHERAAEMSASREFVTAGSTVTANGPAVGSPTPLVAATE